jgi:DNA polymerase III sliding clamp (beta) subunit (PCNA family)
MECEVSRKALREVLIAAHDILPERTTKPILQAVRLSAEDDGLYIESASGANVTLRKRVESTVVKEKGEVVFLPRTVADWLLVRDENPICTIKTTDKGFWCGRTAKDRIEVQVFPPEELPRVNLESADAAGVLEGSVIAKAIQDVLVVIDPKLTDYKVEKTGSVMNGAGALFRLEDGKGYLEGTDMTSMCQCVMEAECNGKFGAFLPVPTAQLIGRVASGAQVKVGLLSNKCFWMSGDGWFVSSPQMAGKAAPIPVIVNMNDKVLKLSVQVGAESLQQAVKAALSCYEKERDPEMAMLVGEGNLELMCVSEYGGSGKDIPVEYDGPKVKLRMCGARFRQIVMAFDKADTVRIRFQDSEKPLWVESLDSQRRFVLSVLGKPR